MIGNFTDMNDCRVLAHLVDSDEPEIRFINDKTGDVYRKKLTDDEVMSLAYYFNKLVDGFEGFSKG